MTPRWIRISYLLFGLAWLILGTVSLAQSDTVMGGLQLVLGVGWLLITAFNDWRLPH